jgi:hypothetical protein
MIDTPLRACTDARTHGHTHARANTHTNLFKSEGTIEEEVDAVHFELQTLAAVV